MSNFEHTELDASTLDLPTEGSDAENVLILDYSSDPTREAECMDHLQIPVDTEPALVLVTLNEPPKQRLRVIRDYYGSMPAHVSIICTAKSLGRSSPDINGVDVTIIQDPSDLARLGVKISDTLSEWSDYPTTLCFNSLTNLLQLVELSRVFRFVYTLGGRVAASDVRAHYHLNPDTHDNHTIETLRPLFDSVTGEQPGEHYRTNGDGSHPVGSGGDVDHDPWDQLLGDDL